MVVIIKCRLLEPTENSKDTFCSILKNFGLRRPVGGGVQSVYELLLIKGLAGAGFTRVLAKGVCGGELESRHG
jgi:hypothetical protein